MNVSISETCRRCGARYRDEFVVAGTANELIVNARELRRSMKESGWVMHDPMDDGDEPFWLCRGCEEEYRQLSSTYDEAVERVREDYEGTRRTWLDGGR